MKRTVRVNDMGLRIGEDHHRATLTDADVDRLVAARESGLSWSRVAAMFDCSVRHARDIVAGKKRGQLAKGFRVVRLPD